MMFRDYFLMYEAGRALLRGEYGDVAAYPFPLVCMFAVFALFRPEVGLIFLLAASLLALVVMFKRRALWWMLYAPVIETLRLGQIDVLMLFLYLCSTPLSLALLSLKPQLFLLAVPRLMRDRVLLKRCALWMAAIYGVPLLIRPSWPIEWLRNLATTRAGETIESITLLPWVAFGAIAALTAARRWHWVTAVTTFNPAFKSYDYTMLAGMTAWLVPLSWLSLFGEGGMIQGAVMAGCGVVVGVASTRHVRGHAGMNECDRPRGR